MTLRKGGLFCPFCGEHHTLPTGEELSTKSDDGEYGVVEEMKCSNCNQLFYV